MLSSLNAKIKNKMKKKTGISMLCLIISGEDPIKKDLLPLYPGSALEHATTEKKRGTNINKIYGIIFSPLYLHSQLIDNPIFQKTPVCAYHILKRPFENHLLTFFQCLPWHDFFCLKGLPFSNILE